MAGGITGVLGVSVGLSLALLIFSEELSSHASIGIGMALFSGFVINIVVALSSSFQGSVVYPQDTPAAILAVAIAAMMARLSTQATEEELLVTAIATITITTLLMGVCCGVIGVLKLGNFIRFIPYPVVGGFLAGTGWLLFKGSFEMMTEHHHLSFADLPIFFEGNIFFHWLLGATFAVTIFWLANRYHHWLILPGCTVAAIALFYLFLGVTHTSIEEAREKGWLLESLAGGLTWHPLNPAKLMEAHWSSIFKQAGNIASIVLLSTIALLLNASTIELETKKDIDLDRELRSVGLGNLLAGLGGGFIGFHGLHESVLSEEVGINSRWVGLFSAAVYGGLLFFNSSVLAFFPKPILGGLILLLALEFLREWLYDSWFKLPKLDYLTILVILVIIGSVGFLQGVAVGLIVTVISFVINYSRMNVSRHTFSGVSRQSNVDRSPEEMQVLQQQGETICILELQGFIFFGTANNLLKQIQSHLRQHRNNPRPLRFVELDFHRVLGLDSSAVLSFVKLEQIAEKNHLTLIYTALSPEIKNLLQRGGCLDPSYCQIFPDLDRGLEWCEEQLLQSQLNDRQHAQKFTETLIRLFGDRAQAGQFMAYLQSWLVDEGQIVFKQADPSEGLYFLESGQISVFLTLPNGTTKRLRTFKSGTIIGEMGLYQNTTRSASVIADRSSQLYHLSKEAFAKMEQQDPTLASIFHRYIVCLLSERLKHREKELKVLLS
jgi:SulP family sulfate permease